MCDRCPEERTRITRKYGGVLVSLHYAPDDHTVHYHLMLGGVTVDLGVPVSANMAASTECLSFIGEHILEVITAASNAYTEHSGGVAPADAEQLVADLEALLRDQPPHPQ